MDRNWPSRIVGEFYVDYYEKDDYIYFADYVLMEKIEYVNPKQPEENPQEAVRQITDQIIQNDSFKGLEDWMSLLTHVDITSKSELFDRHLEIEDIDI